MSRWQLPAGAVITPAVVVDADVLEANLRAAADSAALRGLALRPHVKTHKSVRIGRRQLALGAVGISVATVGEAEVFADGGFEDVFIAYPVWADHGRDGRLRDLASRIRLSVGVDSAAAAQRLAAAAGPAPLHVLVEVDCGLRRSGVAAGDAGRVATAAAAAGLSVAGVFTFPGHSYAPGAPAGAADDEAAALAAAAASVAAEGLPCPVRSGGSTPSAALSSGPAGGGPVTELRPGVYAFNDAQQVTLGTCAAGEVALAVLATVVSAPAPDRFILDAGAKVLGPDRPAWAPGHGLLPDFPGWAVTGLWEHHAVVSAGPAAGSPPQVGDQVAVLPNHVCTVVNLVDHLHVVRGGEVVDRWPVDARGRNT
ncbi:MAG TPA: alanine racemase [Streptosporangiaceae bacterium]|nr:alanine racemase [Streptosporangiaceae bacterium]